MSRHDAERLNDIIAVVAAIADHTTRGGLDDRLVFDAVRVRVITLVLSRLSRFYSRSLAGASAEPR